MTGQIHTDEQKAATDQYLQRFRAKLRQTWLLAAGAALSAIAACGGLGYALDLALDKGKFYTIIGLVIGFVVMNVSVLIISKRLFSPDQEVGQKGSRV